MKTSYQARAPPRDFEIYPFKIKKIGGIKMNIQENQKNYVVEVFDTFTETYESVEVSEEVYNAYRRTEWNIEKNDKKHFAATIPFSSLIGGDDGNYENFHEFVTTEDITAESALRKLRADAINCIMSQLTEKEAQALELLYFHGLSAAEAGKRLGISEQALNKRKRSAFNKIRSDSRLF